MYFGTMQNQCVEIMTSMEGIDIITYVHTFLGSTLVLAFSLRQVLCLGRLWLLLPLLGSSLWT